jgi:hypothetical protein
VVVRAVIEMYLKWTKALKNPGDQRSRGDVIGGSMTNQNRFYFALKTVARK